MWQSSGKALHVVFGMSAAGSVRRALELKDCREEVIGFPDDLSFGPINPPSPDIRSAWIGSVLGFDFEDVTQMAELFWQEVAAPERTPVVWVCRNDAREYAGFLEFIWRMAGRSFDLVDATEIEVAWQRKPPSPPWSLSIMNPEDFTASGLLDRKSTIRLEQIETFTKIWRDLRNENAPFRVMKEGRLTSAPLTCYDAYLEKSATEDWQIAARLIGETMSHMLLGLQPQGQCPSDLVLFSRMLALGKAGIFELEGAGPSVRDYRVRLAPILAR